MQESTKGYVQIFGLHIWIDLLACQEINDMLSNTMTAEDEDAALNELAELQAEALRAQIPSVPLAIPQVVEGQSGKTWHCTFHVSNPDKTCTGEEEEEEEVAVVRRRMRAFSEVAIEA